MAERLRTQTDTYWGSYTFKKNLQLLTHQTISFLFCTYTHFFNHSNKLHIIPSILDMLKFSEAFIALWQLAKIEVCCSLLRWDLKIVALNPINNLNCLIISRVQKEEENYFVTVVSQPPRRTECCLDSVFQSGGKNNQRPSRSIMCSFIPLNQYQEPESMKASILIMQSLQGKELSMDFLWQREDSTVEKSWVTKWAYQTHLEHQDSLARWWP